MSDQPRYRKVFTRLWRHPGFCALNEGDKVVALYVLTGPQSNRIGLYMLSVATAAEDLGTTPETFKKRLANVSATFGWFFDADARVVYIPSWWKWNPPSGGNVLKGNLKDLNEIPSSGLVDAFTHNLDALPETLHETFMVGLRQHLPQPSRTQNQDQDQETESGRQKPEPSARRAVAENEKLPTPNARLIAIAREVLKNLPAHTNLDHLVDEFQIYCRQEQLETTRAEARAALHAARGGALAVEK